MWIVADLNSAAMRLMAFGYLLLESKASIPLHSMIGSFGPQTHRSCAFRQASGVFEIGVTFSPDAY